MSRHVARCLEIVEESGLDYQLTAMGTIIEGEWDQVMEVVRRCHHEVLAGVSRVLTTIRIDDRKGVEGALSTKVASVERVLGRELRK